MSKITPIDLTNLTDTNDFMRFCSQLVGTIVDTINGKLEFDTNLLTQSVSVTFSATNTDTSVSHSLNKTGVKYIVTSKNAACDVYNGLTAASSSTLYLRGTVATTVTLELS